MKPFVLYRLPGEKAATRVSASKTTALGSCCDLDGQSGFVIAPFVPSSHEPILLIEPEEMSEYIPRPDNGCAIDCQEGDAYADREAYANTFAKFHQKLTDGTFRKVVLARQKTVTLCAEADAVSLFDRACALYPRQMVVLVSAESCGTWLMATPEILLQGRGLQWRTMALAGTMKAGEEGGGWSEKNIQEQQLVASHIGECLQSHAYDIHLQGPSTAHAGDLVHLKSDFTFHLRDEANVGHLLHDLYPTPAVCGLPKDATRQFIVHHEPKPRRYYSGFMGPLNINANATDLYVSLRCMALNGSHCTLYAGGGLISESNEQQEWDETEAKMRTMLRCINGQM